MVEGYPDTGTVSNNGTYYAPAVLPTSGLASVSYAGAGESATVTLKLQNPAVSIASVTPNRITALITSVLISGSGFVHGSTILVNGTAIPTVVVDSNLAAGVVVLPQEVNATVQLAVSNPNPGASTSASLQVPAVFAPISVTASQSSVPAGGTTLFAAARQGSALSGGSWAVTGGNANGSIDSYGTYHAPTTAPAANQISVVYTHNGATGTGSVSVTNPVPVATSVSPSTVQTLSTPIVVTGSGFVSGSTILVNGKAISTTFADTSHLSGVVVLPQEVNATVQLAVSNPNPGASTSASLQVPAVFAPISVTASQSSVPAGGTTLFAAARQGSALSGGSWAVTGGNANGSIDSYGTYHAPTTAPAANQISVVYTHNGATGTGSVSVTNPVPVATSVSPSTVQTLSTPIVVTGSGFVSGSTILVNGKAISTTFADTSHLSGVVVLPQEVNATVQLAVSNPNPGASTSASLQVPAVFAPISVTASQSSVPAGGTTLFAAARQGSALSGGSWAVTGGNANGSIDSYGTYHAPTTAPAANQISVVYTHNGATGTGSVSVTNPVPVATSVSPSTVQTLSTPIVVTGSGFVSGSTILVNGKAISTTFADTSHLSGVVVLPQEVNATVQLAVSNPNPGASTSASLQVPAVFAPISVTASQSSVPAGGTTLFAAARQGSALSGGSWAVTGGNANGSIDSYGTYHAPTTAPAANQISVVYTHNGATGTGSVSVTNPVPVATSVSPSTVQTLSTPIVVTGSGFVSGSTILVNNAPIPTALLDSSHLSGTLSLQASVKQTLLITVQSPDPNPNTSAVLTIDANFPQASIPALTRSFNTPSYFMEQSDEFVGPFPSWTNVKTAFGAVGDGVADDTAAIQRAINSLTDDSPSCVLFLPAGTYNLSTTLHLTHMRTFSIIGEDPGTTRLKWVGAQGGTMLQADGSTYFKIGRLSFDGSGVADIAEDLTTVTLFPNNYYSTFNELSDQHIVGTKVGVHLGIDAETAVERVFFDHLSTAGLTVGDFNTLNIFINDSLFLNCGTGLTNVYQNGAGSLMVSNSFFVHSQVADISIANTGPISARHNTSVGSKTFFLSYEIYDNSSTVTLQNNTILDPLTTPFQFGNLGPFMLVDNVVRLQNSTIPMIEASWTASSLKDVFSMGNSYTSNGGIGTGSLPFQGRVVSYDDATVPISSIADVAVPSNVYVPPNLHRFIFETNGRTGAAVQAAINLATASGLPKPVVHLTRGIYPVSTTLTLPAGSDIQLIGDDVYTTALTWNGASPSPVLIIPTSNVSLKNLRIDGAGEGTSDGILLKIADEPNTQVILNQTTVGSNNSYGVNFDGLEHATVEMFSTYATGSITGVKVTGGAFRAAKEGTLGITNHYTGSLQSEGTSTSFDVSAGGKYMVQDNWHDLGATSPQNFKLSGSGTVTEQGGAIFMNSASPFEIDNFSGNVTLMGFGFTGGFNLASTSGQANLLNLGLVGNSAVYLPSSTSNITVGNVLNSYSGGHIAQTANPDVVWMRGMLAQTRSEYPIPRPTLVTGANRIRLNRVMVDLSSSAVHIVPDAVKSGLYYVLRSGVSNLANTSDACVGTTLLDRNDQWLIMAAGEGDFEIISKASGAALGLATSANQTLVLEPLSGEYDQRWMINELGNGEFSLLNRQTGNLLSLPAAGACAGIAIGGATNWTINAY